MNDQEIARMRRFTRWGILGLFVLVGVSIVASLAFYASQPSATFRPFFPFGWLGGLFFIFIAFWLVKWLFWPWRWHYAPRYWRYSDNAYTILRERYARGEITKEQFEQMMRDLQQDRSQAAS